MILDINQLFMLKSMLRKDRMLTAGILKIDVNVLLQFYVPWIFYVLWLIHSICFGFFVFFSRFSSLIMQICFDQLSRVVRPGISQFNSIVPALFTCNIDLQKLCYPVTWSNPVFLTNIILNIKNWIMSNISTAKGGRKSRRILQLTWLWATVLKCARIRWRFEGGLPYLIFMTS